MFDRDIHLQLSRRNNNFHDKILRRKPYINNQNQKKRLIFAKICNKHKSFWEKMIFSDKSKFNNFNSEKLHMEKTKYEIGHPKCTPNNKTQ